MQHMHSCMHAAPHSKTPGVYKQEHSHVHTAQHGCNKLGLVNISTLPVLRSITMAVSCMGHSALTCMLM
jgi:hypothetical protein